MSICERGEPDEAAVLMMARCGGPKGFELIGLSFEQRVRAAGAELAARGLARIEADRLFITPKGRELSMGART